MTVALVPAPTGVKFPLATAFCFLVAVIAALICSAVGVAPAATVTSATVGFGCSGTVVVKSRCVLSPVPVPALAVAVIVRLPEILSLGTVTLLALLSCGFVIVIPESCGAVHLPSASFVSVTVLISVSLTG